MVMIGCEALHHTATTIIPQPEAPAEPVLYPESLDTGPTWDVEVVRLDSRHIQLTNRTVHKMANVPIFLNEQYGTTVEALPIGEPVTVQLQRFVNQYGERFPVGSFLEPDKARVLVLAEAVSDTERHRLNVRLVDDWDQP
jgi:hypothetical protein